MKKRSGIIGTIWQIISVLIWLGLALAILIAFDWDIIAIFSWIYNFFKDIIIRIADFFVNNDLFRRATTG